MGPSLKGGPVMPSLTFTLLMDPPGEEQCSCRLANLQTPFSSLLPLFLDPSEYPRFYQLSRKSATIFGNGTIPEPSASHIGKGVALVARAAAFVYIYARIPQIAEMTLSFYATPIVTTFSGPACCFDLSRLLRILQAIGDVLSTTLCSHQE